MTLAPLRDHRSIAMRTSFLTPLLRRANREEYPPGKRDQLERALAVDPALSGRFVCDAAGSVVLTGPSLGAPPISLKERSRWELHVRLRLAAELGGEVASVAVVRWVDGSELASIRLVKGI